MLRFIFLIILIFTLNFGQARLPQLAPIDVKIKTEEILKAHALYKTVDNEVAKRILIRYLEELDPTKTYFIESDIKEWLEPSQNLLTEIISSFKTTDFKLFEKIHAKMATAIERRQQLEMEIDTSKLPEKVLPEEINNENWPKERSELLDKLLKIRALQIDIAAKLNDEPKDSLLSKIKKRRIHKENEITQSDLEMKRNLIYCNILKAFASALDAHTAYFTPSEAQDFMIQVQQKLFGIGAQLKDTLHGFSIVRIIEGSPASKSKLKVNDKIIAVDGEPIIGMDSAEAVEMIRGEKGTNVALSVIRDLPDGTFDKFDLTLARGEVVFEESRMEYSIEPYGNGAIANLKLHSFYQDSKNSSALDLKKVLEKVKKDYSLKGVILDLRGNSGGVLPQAVAVASLFMEKGIVVSIKEHSGIIQHLRNTEGHPIWEGPLLVLTSKVSASAAEIVAQCLQDYGRAIIVGDEKTFGKGTFQTFTLDGNHFAKVNPKGEYKVTRGRYYTVSGKTPQLTGVKADIVVPGILSEMEVGEDLSEYPLPNDHISANFEDKLLDIPPMHREKIAMVYKNNLQPVLFKYTQHLDLLKKNSKKRITENKNYQKFLNEIKEKRYDSEAVELFGANDLQLIEAENICKDLIYLDEISNKYF